MRDNPAMTKRSVLFWIAAIVGLFLATDLPTAVASATAPARVSMKISKPYRMIVLPISDVTLVAPNVDKPETVHFILRVSDKGNPPLSRYKRVIVTITP
jgi:hypothetical protein